MGALLPWDGAVQISQEDRIPIDLTVYGEEDHRCKMPFSLHHIEGNTINMTSFVDVDLHHLAEVSDFSTVKLLFPLPHPLSTLSSLEGKSLHSSTLKESGVMPHHLEDREPTKLYEILL